VADLLADGAHNEPDESAGDSAVDRATERHDAHGGARHRSVAGADANRRSRGAYSTNLRA